MTDRYLTSEDLNNISNDEDIVTMLVNLALFLAPDSEFEMKLEDWRTDLHVAVGRIPPVAPTIGLICVALKQAVGFLTLIQDTDPESQIMDEDSIGVYTKRMVSVREYCVKCLHLLRDRHFQVLGPDVPVAVRIALDNLYLRAEALTVEPTDVRDGLFQLTQEALVGR